MEKEDRDAILKSAIAEKTRRTQDLLELGTSLLESCARAMADGDRNGKHAAGSWQQETEENQLRHVQEHLERFARTNQMLAADAQAFTDAELDHAICRLGILKTLRKRRLTAK